MSGRSLSRIVWIDRHPFFLELKEISGLILIFPFFSFVTPLFEIGLFLSFFFSQSLGRGAWATLSSLLRAGHPPPPFPFFFSGPLKTANQFPVFFFDPMECGRLPFFYSHGPVVVLFAHAGSASPLRSRQLSGANNSLLPAPPPFWGGSFSCRETVVLFFFLPGPLGSHAPFLFPR